MEELLYSVYTYEKSSIYHPKGIHQGWKVFAQRQYPNRQHEPNHPMQQGLEAKTATPLVKIHIKSRFINLGQISDISGVRNALQ